MNQFDQLMDIVGRGDYLPGDRCVGGAHHCSFEVVSAERDAVTIRDLNLGGKSVTNDAAHVVEQLRAVELLKPGKKLFYIDSMGELELDEIVWEGVAEISFRPGPGRAVPDERR